MISTTRRPPTPAPEGDPAGMVSDGLVDDRRQPNLGMGPHGIEDGVGHSGATIAGHLPSLAT